MATLIIGLSVETIGLAWDTVRHLSDLTATEGFIAPAHAVILLGYLITMAGAVLVWRQWRHTGSTS